MAVFIRGLHNLQPKHRGNVVTIGSFDGVHLGHQAILRQVREQALKLSLPSLAMIFEPQPHEYFSGEKAPARLMRLREKVVALFDAGIDRVLCVSFNQKLSGLTAEGFIQQVLVDGLDTAYLVVGDDFRFGENRQGDYQSLILAGQQYGFTVTDTLTLLDEGLRISSTRIRKCLEQSDFKEAERLLGHPYRISGKVVKGNQLGRKIGVPTANVHLHRYRSPLTGVFVVSVTLDDQDTVDGVANVGIRPTVTGDTKPILEVHLFDRHDDLYGQEIKVEFKYKLREEKKFDDIDALKDQIYRDITFAREYLRSFEETLS